MDEVGEVQGVLENRHLNLTRREDGNNSWENATRLNRFDRPWCVNHSANREGMLIATRAPAEATRAPHVIWYNASQDVQLRWNNTVNMTLPVLPLITGFLRQTADETIHVPLTDEGDANGLGTLYYTFSNSPLDNSTWVNNFVDLEVNDVYGFPWTAIDSSGKVYLAFRNLTHIRYVHKMGSQWYDCTVASESAPTTDAVVWGNAAVAGNEGNLAIAWYAKESLATPWKLKLLLLRDAHTSSPKAVGSTTPIVVDSNVADATQTNPYLAFHDLLSMERFPGDDHLLIVYNCYHSNPLDSPCGTAGRPHIRVAEQTGGFTI